MVARGDSSASLSFRRSVAWRPAIGALGVRSPSASYRPSTMIYLDNNATTRVADEVITAMTPYYRAIYGNAHAVHSLGRGARDGVEGARESLAVLMGCDPGEVIFTS